MTIIVSVHVNAGIITGNLNELDRLSTKQEYQGISIQYTDKIVKHGQSINFKIRISVNNDESFNIELTSDKLRIQKSVNSINSNTDFNIFLYSDNIGESSLHIEAVSNNKSYEYSIYIDSLLLSV
ncbi:hypothetical protein RJI07_01635 [Mycoplasmatota bacterium WC30]